MVTFKTCLCLFVHFVHSLINEKLLIRFNSFSWKILSYDRFVRSKWTWECKKCVLRVKNFLANHLKKNSFKQKHLLSNQLDHPSNCLTNSRSFANTKNSTTTGKFWWAVRLLYKKMYFIVWFIYLFIIVYFYVHDFIFKASISY